MKRTFPAVTLVLAGLILFCRPASAQARSFLLIPGIEGEAQDKDHKNWIDVIGVSWGGAGKAPAAAGGPGWVIIIKRTDRTSSSIKGKAAGKQRLAEVTLETPGTGRDGTPGTWTYYLTDVTIASYKPASGSMTPQESVTLNYKEISHTYTPQGKSPAG